MEASVDEMLADYWAHTYFEDPKAAEAVEDDDFDPDEVAELIGYREPNDWEDLQ